MPLRRKLADSISKRARLVLLAFSVASATPLALTAQGLSPDSTAGRSASSSSGASAADSLRTSRRRFHQLMTLGFATSIVAHESSHFVAGYLIGGHPHFELDGGKPTVNSGLNEKVDRHKQFVFSAAGLTVQELVDELVLDVPHRRGGAFERGILAGGIGTTLFYTTIGRNSPVSDISVMARTSSLSKTQISLIFGAVSALHTVRIARNGHYARFFAAPSDRGLNTGVSIRPD